MVHARALAVFLMAGTVVLWTAPIHAQRGAPPPRDGAATAPAVGTGSIGGVVVSTDVEPKPVRRAAVTLRDTDRGTSRVAITDDTGRFVFDRLATGRFTVTVTKAAYVPVAYGARTPRGQGLTIALNDGQRVPDLSIPMTRGGVLTGRVTDELGQAVTGLRVTAAEQVVVGGDVTYRYGSVASTDDRGAYRIFGLSSGSYILAGAFPMAVTPRATTADEVRWAQGTQAATPGTAQSSTGSGPIPGRPVRLATTYYPSVTDAALVSAVTLATGEEKAGLDFTMQRVPAATLSGLITRTDGQPVRGALVTAVSTARNLNIGLFEFPPRATVTPAGEFTLTGLQPGRYLLTARAPSTMPPVGRPPMPGGGGPPPQVSDLWALSDIVVTGEDVNNLRLDLAPGMTVSGRVVFEAAATTSPADPTTVAVSLTAPPGTGTSLGVIAPQVNADGTFQFLGVAPGSFLLRAGLRTTMAAAPTWVVKSATSAGKDVLDTALDVRPGGNISDLVVTFTDRVTQISGLVTDGAGRAVPTYSVIVFPTDPTRWYQGSRWLRVPTRPASDGRFSITGLPPGEYHMAMLAQFEQNEWYTPGFLQQVVPGAIRITLAEGEQKTQDLKLAGG